MGALYRSAVPGDLAARLACVPARECSRTACTRPAVSTLTYVYADSTAVLGPLARHSEPHTYDLCREHSTGLTVPRGWRVIRVPGAAEGSDDLVAIADAVRHRPTAFPGAAASPGESPDRTPPAAPPGGASRTASTGRTLQAVRRPTEDDAHEQERRADDGERR